MSCSTPRFTSPITSETETNSKTDAAWVKFLTKLKVDYDAIREMLPEEIEVLMKQADLTPLEMALVRTYFNRLSQNALKMNRVISLGVGRKIAQRLSSASDHQALTKYDKLLSVTHEISLELDLDRAIHRVVTAMRELLRCDRVELFMINAEEQCLECRVSQSEIGRRVPIGKGIIGTVAKTGEFLNIADCKKDDRFDPSLDAKNGYTTHHILCLAIHDDFGDIIAVVQAINKLSSQSFDKSDEALALALVAQAGHILRRAILFSREKRARLRSEALLEVMRAAKEEKILWDFVNRVAQSLYKVLDCDGIALYIVDPIQKELVCRVSKLVPQQRFSMTTGIAGYVATEGKKINVRDAYTIPMFNNEVDKQHNYRTKSMLCLPVKNRDGKILAVIQAINKTCSICNKMHCSLHNTYFDTEDEQILEAISSEIEAMLSRHSLETAFEHTMHDPSMSDDIRKFMGGCYNSFLASFQSTVTP